MKSLIQIFFVLFFLFNIAEAQQNIIVNGYLENFQTAWKPKLDNKLKLTGTINNRFNFALYPSEKFTLNISLRNIVVYGDFVSSVPNYADFITEDIGYLNLTKKISSGNSSVFYMNIDRLNLIYSGDDVEVEIGRQRINLGINLVWTPNDIFNSSSFLDFDYVEKAGSDAFRFQYYTGITSSVEFVYKVNRAKEISAAGIIKFNKWEYDFQLLGGVMEKDYVLGGGWAGQISGAGFTGEITYFRDKDSFSDTTGVLVSAIGFSYTFQNSLLIHGEFLYNSVGKTENAGGLNNIFNQQYSAKNLSSAKYSLFGELSYQLTPLNNLDFSVIFNPSDNSFYAGPSLNISLTENIYLLTAAQFFSGNQGTEWGDYGQFYYLRLKWNF